jgi:hypothetical protein
MGGGSQDILSEGTIDKRGSADTVTAGLSGRAAI